MKYIIEELKLYKKETILAPLFKMLEALFDLFVPLVVAYIINEGIGHSNYKVIYTGIALLVLLAFIGIMMSITAQYFAAKASVLSTSSLREKLYQHIITLSLKEVDHIGTSTLITRMTSDINQIQNGINMFLRLALRSPFIVFGSLIMAFMINPEISLIFLGTIIVLAIIIYLILVITTPGYKTIQEKLDYVLLLTRENLTGVRVIRAFVKTEDEINDFENKNDALKTSQISVGRISGLLNPLTYAAVNIGIIGIIYYGSKQVNSGLLLSGDIVALINYINQILVELIKFANTIVLLSKTGASITRVEEILDTKTSMTYGTDTTLDLSSPLLEVKDISYGYNEVSEECLSHISFTLNHGQTLGIIGPTGSGKTTLINIINRSYDVTTGTVLLGNKDIKAYTKKTLSNIVHTVNQKTQLFSGTIRSNLLYGNSNASDEQLLEALEIAQATDIIKSKENDIDALVEQDGRNLSGGQRQRLSIARALLGNYELLILDDSSSALDYATDKHLMAALKKLSKAMIIVSQRTTSVKDCDQILVLEDGKCVGLDTHDHLLKTCDVYKEINALSNRGDHHE